MDTLQKQFFRMVSYSGLGVVSGGVIGTIFGALINGLYYLSNRSNYIDGKGGYGYTILTEIIFNPAYAIIGGIIGGILAAAYIIRVSKTDERLNNLRKNFVNLIVYMIFGLIFGSLVAVSYGLIIGFIYSVILNVRFFEEFITLPFLPIIGGVFGVILSSILVIKMSKSEQK